MWFVVFCVVFFFKQKTAYEMRISDWSSDVCSSDLLSGLDEDARAALRAGRVGFVFQSFQLLAGFTALENVMLPAELAGLDGARGRARAALERVGLAARLDHYPHTLSGGEQQRVALEFGRASCRERVCQDV